MADDPKNWSPLRRYFEAFRGVKKLLTGPHEPIPEALVRDVLAQQYGIKPDEVTWEQIRSEVARLLPDYPAITFIPTQIPSQPEQEAKAETTVENEIERRQRLLAAYKFATGNPSNRRIYQAANSGIHKPEFYHWQKGNLSSESATCINFERFLRDKKPPIPRRHRD